MSTTRGLLLDPPEPSVVPVEPLEPLESEEPQPASSATVPSSTAMIAISRRMSATIPCEPKRRLRRGLGMGDRLSARDLAFLTRETVTTLHHLASIEILDPAESGFDYDTLLSLVADRLSFVPRYRQRVQLVP